VFNLFFSGEFIALALVLVLGFINPLSSLLGLSTEAKEAQDFSGILKLLFLPSLM
jgi:hypothetical protein